MRSSKSFDLLEPDPEIEKIIRRLLKEMRDREAMMALIEERKALRDYVVQSTSAAISCIIKPTIQANNFKLRTGVIQLVQNTCQFGGRPDEDPNEYIKSFLEISDTQKHNGVSLTQYN